MERIQTLRAVAPQKALLVASAGTLIWLLVWSPDSVAPGAMVLRVVISTASLAAVAVTPLTNRKRHTLCLWATIGATLGFGVGGLIGIGPLALMPFGFVMGYAIVIRHTLDAEVTLSGAALSFALMILVSLPVRQPI